MKKLFFIQRSVRVVGLLLFFNCASCIVHRALAQPGEWVWVHGDNVINSPGSFGTQGVPAATNKPPSFYEACEWTDLNGNFWLFGGLNSFSDYGDLWKYDPTSNEWTWIKGTGVAGNPGNFGTQGISSPTNQPPAREHGVITWTDLSGNLWLFGGATVIGDLNDLWKYDISTNEWTWMKGTMTAYDPGVYGTQGVSSPANTPSSKEEAASSWTDNNGDLWFFGGWKSGTGAENDLWKYNIATNEWTWMKGSQLISQPGVYGTLGVEDTANTPGARCCYTHWKDNTGNLWLFGGEDFSANTYNDMWRYNPLTNSWAWMNGSNIPGAPASYNTRCVSSPLNDPGTRYENRVVWTDVNGNFWSFGGNRSFSTLEYKNDLWMYCVATNEWTWVSGDSTSNTLGNYGTLGVSSPLNSPSGRMGSIAWRAQTGELYLFGGTTNPFGSFLNDLWKFTIDPACALCNSMPVAVFNAPNHICPGTCTNFNNISINATSYQWMFAGATPGVSTDVNPTNICYNTPGQYDVTLIATNANGSDTLLLHNFITVYPYPAPQGIAQNGDTLFANQGAVSYQWYHTGVLIPGATDYFYVATGSGDYNVVATDANGCEVEAAIFDVVASVQSAVSNSQFAIYPNPVVDKCTIHDAQFTMGSATTITIYNMLGEKVLAVSPLSLGRGVGGEVDVSALPSGLYYLEIDTNEKIFRTKFIKQ